MTEAAVRSPRGAPKRSYDPARSRARILKAAEDLFVSQPFESTTIREVAARAGVPSSLLYYYYGDKEGLFAEVQRNLYVHVVEAMGRLKLAHPPSREGIAEFLGQFFDVVSRYPNLFRLNPSPAMLRNRRIREVEHGTMQLLVERGEAYLREGMEKGAFRKVEPRNLMLAFHGMIRAVFVDRDFNHVLYGRKNLSPELLAGLRGTLIDMALRTLFPDDKDGGKRRGGRG